jgi:hypothetical protein
MHEHALIVKLLIETDLSEFLWSFVEFEQNYSKCSFLKLIILKLEVDKERAMLDRLWWAFNIEIGELLTHGCKFIGNFTVSKFALIQ